MVTERKEKKDTQAISIRFPLGMYKRLTDMSEAQHRSFNKQVVHLLREYLSDMDDADKAEFVNRNGK